MSKEHYISPEEFKFLVSIGELFPAGYGCKNSSISNAAQYTINLMRDINSKDPGFKYSCECSEECTLWYFGYTIKEIYEEAKTKLLEIIEQNRIRDGVSTNNICYTPPGDYSACNCPLDM